MRDNSFVAVPQVGAVVEVKNQDGVYQEATINKLTDASIYTVGKSGTMCLSFPHALKDSPQMASVNIPKGSQSSFTQASCLKILQEPSSVDFPEKVKKQLISHRETLLCLPCLDHLRLLYAKRIIVHVFIQM